MDRIDCYIFDRIDSMGESQLAQALDAVSPARRAKALTYVNAIDRKLSVAAELLLRRALRDMCISQLPRIAEGEYGKPYFPDSPHLHFSISHCRLCVACAVSAKPIGIDVECIDSYAPDLAEAVLNAQEQREVLASPSPAEAFVRYWTMKESYLKLTGTGLTDDLPNLLSPMPQAWFHSTVCPKGYVATVCAYAASEVQIYDCEISELI